MKNKLSADLIKDDLAKGFHGNGALLLEEDII